LSTVPFEGYDFSVTTSYMLRGTKTFQDVQFQLLFYEQRLNITKILTYLFNKLLLHIQRMLRGHVVQKEIIITRGTITIGTKDVAVKTIRITKKLLRLMRCFS